MMKSRKIIFSLIFVLVFTGFGFRYYLNLPSDTPEQAIKKYVFLMGNPIEAFNLSIEATNIEDKHYGRLYEVRGYYGEPGPVEIFFFI